MLGALVLAAIGAGMGLAPAVCRGGWSEAVPVRVLALAAPLFRETAEKEYAALLSGQAGAQQPSTRWQRVKLLHVWARSTEEIPETVHATYKFVQRGGPENVIVVRTLVRLLESENSMVRSGAASAFSWAMMPSRRVHPALVERLEDPEQSVRSAAAASIGGHGSGAEPLIPLLRDAAERGLLGEWEAIRAVQGALECRVDWYHELTAQLPRLVLLLDDPRWQVREAAADAIGLIEHPIRGLRPGPHMPDAVEALLLALAKEEHAAPRRKIVSAIAAREWTHPGSERHAERMVALVHQDPDPGVRAVSLGAAGMLLFPATESKPLVGDPPVLVKLAVSVLTSPDAPVRQAAVDMLSYLNPTPASSYFASALMGVLEGRKNHLLVQSMLEEEWWGWRLAGIRVYEHWWREGEMLPADTSELLVRLAAEDPHEEVRVGAQDALDHIRRSWQR